MLGLSGLGYQTAARMGLLKALNAASYTINENIYKDRKGKELLRLRYRDFIRDLPYLALRRNDLVRALADALPDTASIRFNDHIESFTDKGDRVEARLASGAILQADLLIGADGFRSSTRQQLFGSDNNDPGCLQPLGYYFAVYDVAAPRSFETDFLSYAEPGHLAEYYSLHGGRLAAMHVWRDQRAGSTKLKTVMIFSKMSAVKAIRKCGPCWSRHSSKDQTCSLTALPWLSFRNGRKVACSC